MLGRSAAPVATALLALAFWPAVAVADPTFRATADEAEVVGGQTRGLTYRLQMRTGDAAERFTVSARIPPAFGPFGAEGENFASGTLQRDMLAGARLEGPGTLRFEGGPIAGGLPSCSRAFSGFHGTGTDNGRLIVELPQHQATTTLVLQTELARDAPWPGRDFRFAFALGDTRDPAFPGTLDGPATIDAPVPPYRGPRGTRITLASEPETGCSSFPGQSSPPLERRTVDLLGRTEPPLPAGQLVRLDVAVPGAPPALLARVPVAADGTFAMRDWRPEADGFFEVAARYESQSPELADDFSDPINFNLKRPVLRPVLRVAARTLRPSPSGRIGLGVSCPAGTSGGCRGTLRIDRAGALVASGRFEVPAGARRTLRLLPSAYARRLLRGTRAVATRVRVTGPDGGRRTQDLALRPAGRRG